jgi:hypothetical protein
MNGKRYYITTMAAWRRHAAEFATSHWVSLDSAEADYASSIIVLVEADEGAHLALEDDSAFESLPHPLDQRPISVAAAEALAVHGVTPCASTFEVAEKISRIHPLMRHRIF